VLNCFSGWVLNNANENGYTVLQLIFIYSLGVWVKREELFKKYSAIHYFIVFVVSSIFICVCSILSLFVLKGSNFPVYYYNNPLVVLASLALFCCFSQVSLQSDKVNVVASTVVAALFIQDFIASRWIYTTINNAYNVGIVRYLINCFVFGAGIFITAFLIENLRQMIFRPVIDRLVSICEKVLERKEV
jgi:hypothetical protein